MVASCILMYMACSAITCNSPSLLSMIVHTIIQFGCNTTLLSSEDALMIRLNVSFVSNILSSVMEIL